MDTLRLLLVLKNEELDVTWLVLEEVQSKAVLSEVDVILGACGFERKTMDNEPPKWSAVTRFEAGANAEQLGNAIADSALAAGSSIAIHVVRR